MADRVPGRLPGAADRLQAALDQARRAVRSSNRLPTIRGHVFCSFLAQALKAELEERIAALGRTGSWPQIIADLDSLTETEIEYDGKRFVVRSAPRPAASLALRAAGVALRPTVRAAHRKM